MPSAPRHSERRLRNALSLATALAGIAAVSGLLADPGQAPADPPVAAKATASTAAAKPEVVSALTLPRPAHDITVSQDGRIFMMMVDAPALVEWVNGELRAYPDAGWNDAKAPDRSHALVRPCSLRIGPDGLLWVLDTGQPGVDHGGPKFVAFDLETTTSGSTDETSISPTSAMARSWS